MTSDLFFYLLSACNYYCHTDAIHINLDDDLCQISTLLFTAYPSQGCKWPEPILDSRGNASLIHDSYNCTLVDIHHGQIRRHLTRLHVYGPWEESHNKGRSSICHVHTGRSPTTRPWRYKLTVLLTQPLSCTSAKSVNSYLESALLPLD